jgi:hypothetical protein
MIALLELFRTSYQNAIFDHFEIWSFFWGEIGSPHRGAFLGPKSALFCGWFLPQRAVGRNVSHALPPFGPVSFFLSLMSTWLEQKPIKNRWQPLPHQTVLLPMGILARGTPKKSLPGVQNAK